MKRKKIYTRGQQRQRMRDESNNAANPNKNICTFAVANALHVAGRVRYLHNVHDVVRAARSVNYTVRSRGSKVKGKTVEESRRILRTLANKIPRSEMNHPKWGVVGFIVRTQGHVLFLGEDGRTLVDTDAQEWDSRKITHCYIVY